MAGHAGLRQRLICVLLCHYNPTGSGKSFTSLMKKLRGRPDSQALPVHRERLLSAASEVFLADGFEGAKVDVIAAKAGVSKVTIYRRYTSKAGLFEAVALHSVERLRRKSREVETANRPPAEVLYDFALAIYEGATHAESVAVMRLAIAETSQFPEVAKMLWDHRFETFEPLARYLEQLAAERIVAIEHPMQAAIQLSSLVSGGIGMLVDKPLKSRAARNSWVRSTVELFLNGCLRRPARD